MDATTNFCPCIVPRYSFSRLHGPELFPEWNLSRIRVLFGVLLTKRKIFVVFKKIWELFGIFFGCFWQICSNSVLFWELFQRFVIIWKLFGAFLTNFEIAQNFLCYFLCYFLKNSEFGRTPDFGSREQHWHDPLTTFETLKTLRQGSKKNYHIWCKSILVSTFAEPPLLVPKIKDFNWDKNYMKIV